MSVSTCLLASKPALAEGAGGAGVSEAAPCQIVRAGVAPRPPVPAPLVPGVVLGALVVLVLPSSGACGAARAVYLRVLRAKLVPELVHVLRRRAGVWLACGACAG